MSSSSKLIVHDLNWRVHQQQHHSTQSIRKEQSQPLLKEPQQLSVRDKEDSRECVHAYSSQTRQNLTGQLTSKQLTKSATQAFYKRQRQLQLQSSMLTKLSPKNAKSASKTGLMYSSSVATSLQAQPSASLSKPSMAKVQQQHQQWQHQPAALTSSQFTSSCEKKRKTGVPNSKTSASANTPSISCTTTVAAKVPKLANSHASSSCNQNFTSLALMTAKQASFDNQSQPGKRRNQLNNLYCHQTKSLNSAKGRNKTNNIKSRSGLNQVAWNAAACRNNTVVGNTTLNEQKRRKLLKHSMTMAATIPTLKLSTTSMVAATGGKLYRQGTRLVPTQMHQVFHKRQASSSSVTEINKGTSTPREIYSIAKKVMMVRPVATARDIMTSGLRFEKQENRLDSVRQGLVFMNTTNNFESAKNLREAKHVLLSPSTVGSKEHGLPSPHASSMMNPDCQRSAGPASGLIGSSREDHQLSLLNDSSNSSQSQTKIMFQMHQVAMQKSQQTQQNDTTGSFVEGESHVSLHIPVGVQPYSQISLTQRQNQTQYQRTVSNAVASGSFKRPLISTVKSNVAKAQAKLMQENYSSVRRVTLTSGVKAQRTERNIAVVQPNIMVSSPSLHQQSFEAGAEASHDMVVEFCNGRNSNIGSSSVSCMKSKVQLQVPRLNFSKVVLDQHHHQFSLDEKSASTVDLRVSSSRQQRPEEHVVKQPSCSNSTNLMMDPKPESGTNRAWMTQTMTLCRNERNSVQIQPCQTNDNNFMRDRHSAYYQTCKLPQSMMQRQTNEGQQRVTIGSSLNNGNNTNANCLLYNSRGSQNAINGATLGRATLSHRQSQESESEIEVFNIIHQISSTSNETENENTTTAGNLVIDKQARDESNCLDYQPEKLRKTIGTKPQSFIEDSGKLTARNGSQAEILLVEGAFVIQGSDTSSMPFKREVEGSEEVQQAYQDGTFAPNIRRRSFQVDDNDELLVIDKINKTTVSIVNRTLDGGAKNLAEARSDGDGEGSDLDSGRDDEQGELRSVEFIEITQERTSVSAQQRDEHFQLDLDKNVSPIQKGSLIVEVDEPDRTLHGQYIREEPVMDEQATAANLSETDRLEESAEQRRTPFKEATGRNNNKVIKSTPKIISLLPKTVKKPSKFSQAAKATQAIVAKNADKENSVAHTLLKKTSAGCKRANVNNLKNKTKCSNALTFFTPKQGKSYLDSCSPCLNNQALQQQQSQQKIVVQAFPVFGTSIINQNRSSATSRSSSTKKSQTHLKLTRNYALQQESKTSSSDQQHYATVYAPKGNQSHRQMYQTSRERTGALSSTRKATLREIMSCRGASVSSRRENFSQNRKPITMAESRPDQGNLPGLKTPQSLDEVYNDTRGSSRRYGRRNGAFSSNSRSSPLNQILYGASNSQTANLLRSRKSLPQQIRKTNLSRKQSPRKTDFNVRLPAKQSETTSLEAPAAAATSAEKQPERVSSSCTSMMKVNLKNTFPESVMNKALDDGQNTPINVIDREEARQGDEDGFEILSADQPMKSADELVVELARCKIALKQSQLRNRQLQDENSHLRSMLNYTLQVKFFPKATTMDSS